MKLLKVLLVVLVMAAMVAPAIAEDRLKLNGEMRVRGWYVDRDIDDFGDYSDPDSTDTWADQRLRIGGNIAVAEGVSVTFRFDITESNWGTTGNGNYYGSGRSGADYSNQWDRAHLDLNKGNFHLRAGQFLQVYSVTDSLDAQDNGMSADYKLSNGSVNVFFQVDDNGYQAAVPAKPYYTIDQNPTSPTFGQNIPTGTGAPGVSGKSASDTQDTFLYGAKYSGKFDHFGLDVYGGGWHGDEDLDVMLLGVNATANLGGFKLVGAIDYFTGDHDSDTDAFGQQAMLDASYALSDRFTLGGQLYYAKGDKNDVQYTRIGNGFNGWDPIMDVGTNLSNEQIPFGTPFNVASFGGGEAQSEFGLLSMGSVGGRLYAGFKASDSLKFGASAAYLAEEDDSYAKLDGYALAGGMVWSFMPNTSLHFQAQYVDATLEPDGYSDIDIKTVSLGSGLYVNF